MSIVSSASKISFMPAYLFDIFHAPNIEEKAYPEILENPFSSFGVNCGPPTISIFLCFEKKSSAFFKISESTTASSSTKKIISPFDFSAPRFLFSLGFVPFSTITSYLFFP